MVIPDYFQDLLKSMGKLIKHMDLSILLATGECLPLWNETMKEADDSQTLGVIANDL